MDAALAYAQRGWLVLPCHSPTPMGCSCHAANCSSPGKHPRLATGLRAATTDASDIRRWWSYWPRANVAIRTGADSGLVVIDIDPPHGGDTSLANLVAENGPLPPGLTVRTGSGGAHYYLAHPGVRVRNTAGAKLGPGIDVRGDGGYVIAPPSRHPSGMIYGWAGPGRDLPAMPDWLLDRLCQPERRPPPVLTAVARADGTTSWAHAALTGELAAVRAAPEGRRNVTLNRSAFCLGQVVAGGALEAAHVEGLLISAAMDAGLGETEAARTVASGMAAGLEHPRGPANPRLPTVSLPRVDLRNVTIDAGHDIGAMVCGGEL